MVKRLFSAWNYFNNAIEAIGGLADVAREKTAFDVNGGLLIKGN